MKDFSRLFLPILAAFFLTAVFLGTLAKPVYSDTTGFLTLINNYRAENGISALAEDQSLTNAACWLVTDLDINGFSHTDSLGRSMAARLSDFGVGGSRAENIFYTTSGSSANYAFDSWKNSSGHNTNMLNGTYTRIGIGRANVSGKWYWVTDFANGSATTLNNQCGTAVANPNPSSTSNSVSQKQTQRSTTNSTVQPLETPVSIVEPAPTTITTSSAGPKLEIATKSAATSAPIVRIDDTGFVEPLTLVKGLALGSMLAINLLLFSFIFWKFFYSQFAFWRIKKPPD